MTPSEKYVSELCEKTFLPFWSFANPLGKKGKELCDVLVVCDNTIIIISVKDIRVSEHKDKTIQYDRWVKKAIEDSVNQIYGAERFLKTANEITLKNRKTKITLPPIKNRIIHRIAIAFGSEKDFPLPTGDFGNGYVHVFDEDSTSIIISELDTITDFTEYLIKKEHFCNERIVLIPREIDFLAFYLQTGLDIDKKINVIACENDMWETYIQKPEYLKWKNDILVSYIWDFLIWYMYTIYQNNNYNSNERNNTEQALRLINLEPRRNRIVLGEMLEQAKKEQVKARILRPLENCNHSYVFMPIEGEEWNSQIEGELILRCDVARYENSHTQNVVGVAIGNDEKNKFRFGICCIEIPEIDEWFENHVKTIKSELKYFTKIKTNE